MESTLVVTLWYEAGVTNSYIYKFMTPLPHDYLLIPNKGTINLL